MKMKTKIEQHEGLLIGLCILAVMSLVCHISNYLYPRKYKCKGGSCINTIIGRERFNSGDMSRYNQINHLDLRKCTGLPCAEILKRGSS